ncbi:MAG: hypothetical protein U0746_20535 [Gemmataceae bacterium]
MQSFLSLNLIRLFDFYLAAMFVVGTYRRYDLYRSAAGLAMSMPGRWPNLLKLVHDHRTVFLTWRTLLPSLLTLVVWGLNILASRLVWHRAEVTANLTAQDLMIHGTAWLYALPLATAMVALDTYFLVRVGSFDRGTIEKYFDQAEYWLKGWKAPAVKVLTLGYVNPRQMVNDEVRKALVAAGEMVNRNMYWMILQMGLRIAFGLSLWVTYAVYDRPTA